ncbi:MAG: hypothetical protein AUG88_07165 [Actinobacteria bacterium 13_1_20CM_4_68_12]|nr:MAG: hypothetical protein AUG88_07165 [Actinobacteria bacterium 13_1_20CM_4_68_12]
MSPAEVEGRYANVREALVRDGLDAVIVSGSEYSTRRARGSATAPATGAGNGSASMGSTT